jgi:AcrR family transcriptional regulator
VSLDEIAARAGLTRGALHYNLDARGAALPAGLPASPDDIVGALPFDREFSLLFLEFSAAAARDPDIGAALLERLAGGRQRNVAAVAPLLEHAGAGADQAEDLLHLIGAFVNGLAIEGLAGEDREELNRRFSLLLRLLFAGLREVR